MIKFYISPFWSLEVSSGCGQCQCARKVHSEFLLFPREAEERKLELAFNKRLLAKRKAGSHFSLGQLAADRPRVGELVRSGRPFPQLRRELCCSALLPVPTWWLTPGVH